MFLFNDRWAAFLFFFFMGDVTQKSTEKKLQINNVQSQNAIK